MALDITLDLGRARPAPAIAAAAARRERRQAERAIGHWRRQAAEFGDPPPAIAVDLSRMPPRDWAHRFLIAADTVVENHVFLIYGSRFAALLGLPETPSVLRPMLRQLPERWRPVFAKGCSDALAAAAPVRTDGMFERADGRRELYRAAFMPIAVQPNTLTRLVFGAFNCRLLRPVEPPPA